ncbi:MAG: MAPEG family protein [Candidatus Malihini olakiniferum]
MVNTLYVVLGALLMVKLSLDVVKLRMQYRAAYGDGGFYELQTAIRVHGNAVEYFPIGAILLVLMEMNGALVIMIHLCGMLLIIGCLLHYIGLRQREFRWHRTGIAARYVSLVLMSLFNFYYPPWELVLTLY